MSPLIASRWPGYFYPVTDSARQDVSHHHQKGGENRWLFMLPASLPKRYSRVILAILVACGVLYSLYGDYLSVMYFDEQDRDSTSPLSSSFPEVQQETPEDGLPPLYQAYEAYESGVSERILNSSSTGRYIYFANHPTGCGWGNVLQEMVFGSLLASEANLGYVYDDYTWDTDGRKYSDFNGKIIPARIPLSTMLSGHLLGLSEQKGASEESLPPRSISRRVYERICPQNERVMIKQETAQAYLKKIQSHLNLSADTGLDVLHGWLAVLNSPKYKATRCIEVEKGSNHVFDIWVIGSTRMQSLWTRLSMSPTLQHWGWSPLILHSFERNAHAFAPSTQPGGLLSNLFGGSWSLPSSTKSHSSYPPPVEQFKNSENAAVAEKQAEKKASNQTSVDPKHLDDSKPLPVLALHVRRGDFIEHCVGLAVWNAGYTGMNTFPEFRARDPFVVPRVASTPEEHALVEASAASKRRIIGNETLVASMDDRKRVYAVHCLPDVDQVVRRVREVVHDYVSFARERERIQSAPWWAWSGAVKDERDEAAAPSTPSNDAEPALSERTRPTPNDLLRKVFIQTNAKKEWLAEVKQALIADAERSKAPVDAGQAPEEGWAFEWHWEDVITSRDLEIGWEEKPVAQALDSYISQRAEAFIGNGFSSLTSHVVMLRKYKGFNPLQTRFW